MRAVVQSMGLIVIVVALTACASEIPPSRLGDYVSTGQTGISEALRGVGQHPLEAGLVLISDTADPGAVPNLPDEALTRLGDKLRQEIARIIPVTIKDIIPAGHLRPGADGNAAELSELGRQRKLDYLVVVVLSSTEQEYPVTLFLGWTTHAQPGFRRDNWSLLEFALVDLREDKTLMKAEGRGWATLDRPAAPGINQWYPVIYLRPQDPERHIWPPTFEGAPKTLRVVSFNQAQKRLVLAIQSAWIEYLEAYRAERSGSS